MRSTALLLAVPFALTAFTACAAPDETTAALVIQHGEPIIAVPRTTTTRAAAPAPTAPTTPTTSAVADTAQSPAPAPSAAVVAAPSTQAPARPEPTPPPTSPPPAPQPPATSAPAPALPSAAPLGFSGARRFSGPHYYDGKAQFVFEWSGPVGWDDACSRIGSALAAVGATVAYAGCERTSNTMIFDAVLGDHLVSVMWDDGDQLFYVSVYPR